MKPQVASPPSDPLLTPARFLKGVGPERAALLEGMDLRTAEDVLHHYPRRHEDRKNLVTVADLRHGDVATVRGRISGVSRARTRRGQPIVRAQVSDGTGTLSLVWFGRTYLYQNLSKGPEVFLYGEVRPRGKMEMVGPEVELLGADEKIHAKRIVPIYPSCAGLSQRVIRKILWHALERHGDRVEEFLPPGILGEMDLMDARRALRQIHFPDSEEDEIRARRRMAFDELFLIETTMAVRKNRERRPKPRRFDISDELDRRIRRLFPFTLTGGQDGAVRDLRSDLAGPYPTYRLVQGDVGSGKTVVALYFLLAVVAGKGQAALMAPTEVLADQHYRHVLALLEGSRVRILRLTGGQAGKKRKQDLQAVEGGEVDLVIGTHAVIQKDVRFRDLQALVVDEQHKFGVLQRAALREKGDDPEVLVMTATPIPRSLSLTIYGDLDLSVIRELPPGRLPVRTAWVRRAERDGWYRTLAREMESGRQVFFVYPVIDEPKDGDIRSATEMYDRLRSEVFPRFRVALLHGRMPRDQKDATLQGFRDGKTDLLVSTIVIEVGIDIPNATVMVVDHAERFGLAQLHQLRGRIGRGHLQSTCLLFGDPRTPEGKERLRVMEKTSDGFRIAEEDLRIRGPGEFFGTRQSGLPPLRVADPIRDLPLLEEARREAFRIVGEDPSLQLPENRILRKVLVRRMGDKAGLADIG